MMTKNISVYGICNSTQAAEDTVARLRDAGFRSADISLLVPENEGTKDFSLQKNTKAPEGAAIGGVSGALAGGALGWLIGSGIITITGLGALAAAGPIIAMLAAAGAAGTVGGLLGALAGSGMPEYEAKRYEGRIRRGGILMSVHCDNPEWATRATDLLKHCGAEGIAKSGEAAADFAVSDRPEPRSVLVRK